jgi:hypothetical protein
MRGRLAPIEQLVANIVLIVEKAVAALNKLKPTVTNYANILGYGDRLDSLDLAWPSDAPAGRADVEPSVGSLPLAALN